MKDSKNLKNQNKKTDEQTPSPAVPNRAHTEMNTSGKNASSSQSNTSSRATNSVKKQNTK